MFTRLATNDERKGIEIVRIKHRATPVDEWPTNAMLIDAAECMVAAADRVTHARRHHHNDVSDAGHHWRNCLEELRRITKGAAAKADRQATNAKNVAADKARQLAALERAKRDACERARRLDPARTATPKKPE